MTVKKLIAFVAATLALAVAAGTASADMKKVRIATEGAYAPFNYIDPNGQLQGFDVDIAKALCEKMKAECEIVAQDWDGMIPGLLAKKYDAIIAQMSITEERKKKVDFSSKYANTPTKFVRKKGSGIEITDEGLKGKRIGVQVSTIQENYLREKYGSLVDVKSYDTVENANLDMLAGRVDLLFADAVALDEDFLKTDAGKDFEFVGPAFDDPKWFGEGAGIAVRKGEDELREGFNRAIDEIRKDGTYNKIQSKYFAYDVYGTES
jgi:lysine-arginine-ornithine-binding protein